METAVRSCQQRQLCVAELWEKQSSRPDRRTATRRYHAISIVLVFATTTNEEICDLCGVERGGERVKQKERTTVRKTTNINWENETGKWSPRERTAAFRGTKVRSTFQRSTSVQTVCGAWTATLDEVSPNWESLERKANHSEVTGAGPGTKGSLR